MLSKLDIHLRQLLLSPFMLPITLIIEFLNFNEKIFEIVSHLLHLLNLTLLNCHFVDESVNFLQLREIIFNHTLDNFCEHGVIDDVIPFLLGHF